MFLNKIIIYKQEYHLYMLEKCLYMLQEVRSIIYFQQFIYPLPLHSQDNGTSFAFTSYIIILAKFCDITCLNNFYFVSFFYHLFICQHQRKIRLVTFSKSYLYKLSLVYWASFFLLNSNKALKIIFKTQCLTWEKSTLHCI